MKLLHGLLMLGILICLIGFFSYHLNGQGSQNRFDFHASIGLHFSPWLLIDRTGTANGFTQNVRIEFLSVSTLVLVVALVLEFLRRKVRKRMRAGSGSKKNS